MPVLAQNHFSGLSLLEYQPLNGNQLSLWRILCLVGAFGPILL
jgi:hypothetical protein